MKFLKRIISKALDFILGRNKDYVQELKPIKMDKYHFDDKRG